MNHCDICLNTGPGAPDDADDPVGALAGVRGDRGLLVGQGDPVACFEVDPERCGGYVGGDAGLGEGEGGELGVDQLAGGVAGGAAGAVGARDLANRVEGEEAVADPVELVGGKALAGGLGPGHQQLGPAEGGTLLGQAGGPGEAVGGVAQLVA